MSALGRTEKRLWAYSRIPFCSFTVPAPCLYAVLVYYNAPLSKAAHKKSKFKHYRGGMCWVEIYRRLRSKKPLAIWNLRIQRCLRTRTPVTHTQRYCNLQTIRGGWTSPPLPPPPRLSHHVCEGRDTFMAAVKETGCTSVFDPPRE